VDKCAGCQFYDRQTGKQTDSRGVQWGQCRRSAPMLHPINQKSYMIEGVWPHVRDDDWCGEWKSSGRRMDSRIPESLSAPLLPAVNPSPFVQRPAMASSPVGGSAFPSMPEVGVAASGRGD
jgi:hypothetical protein